MPYVPRGDRPELDAAVEIVAEGIVYKTTGNFSLLREYKTVFARVVADLTALQNSATDPCLLPLAVSIFDVAKKYNYDGAFLGELNYAVTRLIQRVPQLIVATGRWKDTDELRYWLYAVSVSAIVWAGVVFIDNPYGIAGVFIDIKDEYKWKTNRPYEIAQILKSGDCSTAPWYMRVIELRDVFGKIIGHQEVAMKRTPETLLEDNLPWYITVESK